jgi:hypothetical protein
LLSEEENPLQWIRIYPIRYRYLDFDKRYPRWAIVSAKIKRNDQDYRPESFRIDDNSLQIIRKIDTTNNWQERKSLVLSLQFRSIADIQAQGKSLGIIKPKSIERFFSKKTSREWNQKQQAVLNQLDLFEPNIDLEKIPYQFVYQFTDEDNVPHKYSISDWEIMELYRKCRDRSQLSGLEAEQYALEKVRQKLEDDFLESKDLYFIVGNLKNHAKSFMIIGLFYPPLVKFNQMELF